MRLFRNIYILCLVYLTAAVAVHGQTSSFQLITPNGGEQLTGGGQINIAWSGTERQDGDSVNIDFSSDGGTTWNSVAKNVAGSPYKWAVPSVNSNRCLIRITQVDGNLGAADSVLEMQPSGTAGLQVRYSYDGSLIVRQNSADFTLWRTATGEFIRTIVPTSRISGGVSIDPSNTRVAVSVGLSANSYAEVWNIVTGEREFKLIAPKRFDDTSLRGPVYAAVFSPDGNHILLSSGPTVSLWDAATGTIINTLTDIPGDFRTFGAGYSADGSRFYTVGYDSLRIWDAATRRIIFAIPGVGISSVFSRDGRYLSVGFSSDELPLQVWDLESKTLVGEYGDQGKRYEGSMSRDARYITLQETSTRTAKIIRLPGDSEYRASVTVTGSDLQGTDFHPDGMRVATVQHNGRVIVWSWEHTDVSDAPFSITSEIAMISSIAFGPVKVGAAADTLVSAYIRNTSGSPRQIGEISFSEGDTADFTIVNSPAFSTIAPGESATIELRFSPTARGNRSATIRIQNGTQASYTVLEGVGSRGSLTTVPAGSNSFGEVVLGTSVERDLRLVANNGDGPIIIDSIYLRYQGDPWFEIVEGGQTPVVLDAGDTHSIRIRATPRSLGNAPSHALRYREEYGGGVEVQLSVVGVQSLGVDGDERHDGSGALAIIETYPNPASTYLGLLCHVAKPAPLHLQIVDLTGRVVLDERREAASAGERMIELGVESLPAGPYLLVVSAAGERTTETIIISR